VRRGAEVVAEAARYAGRAFSAAVWVLLATVSATPQTLDRHVRIVNESAHDIVAFHAPNVDAAGWQENLLGDGILPAGGSLVLNFQDGGGYCRFRFRAVFADGVELQRNSVNVCEVGTYRYTD
jgi:hypothetical protein